MVALLGIAAILGGAYLLSQLTKGGGYPGALIKERLVLGQTTEPEDTAFTLYSPGSLWANPGGTIITSVLGNWDRPLELRGGFEFEQRAHPTLFKTYDVATNTFQEAFRVEPNGKGKVIFSAPVQFEGGTL